MIYGFSREPGLRIFRWTDNRLAAAEAWASGEQFTGGDFATVRWRRIFKMHFGWRRPRVAANQLLAAILRDGSEITPLLGRGAR